MAGRVLDAAQLVVVDDVARQPDDEQLTDARREDILRDDPGIRTGDDDGVDVYKRQGMTRIVMTNAPTREIVDARSHGVIDGYVVNPVSASTLLAQIRRCV